mmetsp:Transcript_86541/g.231168  ORF Transcript_86541/g.231168 Transcript_86541/m.231168 type:complete len:105 (-) Transcript_86541:49-363(-)
MCRRNICFLQVCEGVPFPRGLDDSTDITARDQLNKFLRAAEWLISLESLFTERAIKESATNMPSTQNAPDSDASVQGPGAITDDPTTHSRRQRRFREVRRGVRK